MIGILDRQYLPSEPAYGSECISSGRRDVRNNGLRFPQIQPVVLREVFNHRHDLRSAKLRDLPPLIQVESIREDHYCCTLAAQ